MEVKKEATAGVYDKYDSQVTVSPSTDGVHIAIESNVLNQFGRQMKASIMDILDRLDVKNVNINIQDKAALDCTMRARLECALFRANDISQSDIPWGTVIKGGDVTRPTPQKNRLRRTMLFMSAQKPALIKDAYIFGCDSIMLDLEDAVAVSEKDAARFSLYQALKGIDYGDTELVVRINGLDTDLWKEDVRVCVAGGADVIRIAKCENAQMVHEVEEAVIKAEEEFGVEKGRTLLMGALESPLGILNAYEICKASDRMIGIALSGGDFRKSMHVKYQPDGIEINTARSLIVLAARAAGVQCFDTVFTDLDDTAGFIAETKLAHRMGFDGKSLINPKQINYVHEEFAPTDKEIENAEKLIIGSQNAQMMGQGVCVIDGKMIDAPFIEDAKRVIKLAKACKVYHGEL